MHRRMLYRVMMAMAGCSDGMAETICRTLTAPPGFPATQRDEPSDTPTSEAVLKYPPAHIALGAWGQHGSLVQDISPPPRWHGGGWDALVPAPAQQSDRVSGRTNKERIEPSTCYDGVETSADQPRIDAAQGWRVNEGHEQDILRPVPRLNLQPRLAPTGAGEEQEIKARGVAATERKHQLAVSRVRLRRPRPGQGYARLSNLQRTERADGLEEKPDVKNCLGKIARTRPLSAGVVDGRCKTVVGGPMPGQGMKWLCRPSSAPRTLPIPMRPRGTLLEVSLETGSEQEVVKARKQEAAAGLLKIESKNPSRENDSAESAEEQLLHQANKHSESELVRLVRVMPVSAQTDATILIQFAGCTDGRSCESGPVDMATGVHLCCDASTTFEKCLQFCTRSLSEEFAPTQIRRNDFPAKINSSTGIGMKSSTGRKSFQLTSQNASSGALSVGRATLSNELVVPPEVRSREIASSPESPMRIVWTPRSLAGDPGSRLAGNNATRRNTRPRPKSAPKKRTQAWADAYVQEYLEEQEKLANDPQHVRIDMWQSTQAHVLTSFPMSQGITQA